MAANQQAVNGAPNFGDLGFYTGGFGIPPGSYALSFTVQMYEAKNAQGVSAGPPRLGVMVYAHSLADPSKRGDNAFSHFYSMGSQADKNFMPNPQTGKGIVAIPGAAGASLNQSTNWAVLLKSLYDSGLPAGIFTGDISVLDGIHVVTAQIDEPAERAGFQSKTAEVQQDRKSNKISVVTEILDNGKPWEGSGGIPAAGPTPAQNTQGPALTGGAVGRPTPINRPAPVVSTASQTGVDPANVLDAATDIASSILMTGSNMMGMLLLPFRTATFTGVQSKYGDATAQAVQKDLFEDKARRDAFLARLGYGVSGTSVKPLA